jgi:hypothetical protein
VTLRPRRLAPIGIAALVMLTLVACQEATPSTQVDAEANLCNSLTAFGSALSDFRNLDPETASVEDVEAARDSVQDAWDEVKAAAAGIGTADDTAVDAAWEAVSTSIDDISTDVPISEALVPVQEAVGGVQDAFDEMRNGVGCE